VTGKHPTKPLIAFQPFQAGILFTAGYFTTPEASEDESGILRLINLGNRAAIIGRYVLYSDDPVEPYLNIEAWYPDPYEKAAFGAFFDGWLNELERFFTANETLGRKYIQ
jgi:hypothetical protein